MLPVFALNIIAHNKVVPKTVVKKLSLSELKIEKIKTFYSESNQNFCISVFNIGDYLPSC